MLQKGLYIILTSLGLAIFFNFLFFDKLIGISMFVFNVIFLEIVYLFGSRQKLSFKKTWWLFFMILFFSLMIGLRDNEFLAFLNICAIFGLLMLLAHHLVGMPVSLMRIIDYFVLILVVPFRMLGRALYTLSLIGQIHSNVKNRDVWIRTIKGIIMALPFLIVFGALFSNADLAFSKFIYSFIRINITEYAIQYTVMLAIVFSAVQSFLAYIFFPKAWLIESPGKHNSAIQSGREIEVLVFIGLIAGLFLLFVGFQIAYLFGGETNIVNAGFTYAEYARRGFFELLVVSILSLLILLASEKYAGVESRRSKKFLIPALIMIAEVIVVMASAFKRLSLYVDAYSLTDLRFYVAGFILLLLALFLLLIFKFIGAKEEQFFVFGTLILAIVFLFVINVVNPDVFIARSNIEQYNRTGKIDIFYMGRLSADAEFLKIELYNRLTGEDKEVLRELLQKDKDSLNKRTKNWQSANYSRFNALKMLQNMSY